MQPIGPTSPLSRVPIEIKLSVFKYLTPVDIMRAESLNKFWQKNATDNRVWTQVGKQKEIKVNSKKEYVDEIYYRPINELFQAFLKRKNDKSQAKTYTQVLNSLISSDNIFILGEWVSFILEDNRTEKGIWALKQTIRDLNVQNELIWESALHEASQGDFFNPQIFQCLINKLKENGSLNRIIGHVAKRLTNHCKDLGPFLKILYEAGFRPQADFLVEAGHYCKAQDNLEKFGIILDFCDEGVRKKAIDKDGFLASLIAKAPPASFGTKPLNFSVEVEIPNPPPSLWGSFLTCFYGSVD